MTGGAPAGPPASIVSDDRTVARWLLVVLALLTALRVIYLVVAGLDLSPDEAHYWEWSRRPDLSYYSKGPLVAYVIYALTATFGTSELSIRLGAVLLSVAGGLVVYRLGRETFPDPRAGLLAVVGLQLTPLFWAGSLLMTIDPPFLVCWTLALLFLYRALARGGADWILAGAAVGLGILAKYSMLFILPGLVLYLWRAPEARAWLGRPGPYLGAAVALVLSLPPVVWNAQHGWVSARHVASQGRGAGLTVVELVEFVGVQLGILTPLIAGLLAWAAWYGIREGLVRRREPYRFLTAFGVPVIAFYLLLSLQGKIQANWPAPAYPSLALVAAGALLERRRRLGPAGRRAQTAFLLAAAGLALGVSALGHVTELLGVPGRLDPTLRLRGWRELGALVGAHRRAMPAPERTFLLAERYQVTSELAFYVEGHPPAYNVNLGRRLNQYDFWEGPERHRQWDAIYVQENVGSLDTRIVGAFDRIEGPFRVDVRRRGLLIRTVAIYRGYGFRGLAPPPGALSY